ncbi:GGDEF domain-containing protein [Pseudokineococcus sp. 1T1Z-3]|uniref:GGDEF domain-containing protein n=1 Tax=Pseudokineococcus sp. 1T1Z-3 TaxID=3132745 RepID=UPI00309929C2
MRFGGPVVEETSAPAGAPRAPGGHGEALVEASLRGGRRDRAVLRTGWHAVLAVLLVVVGVVLLNALAQLLVGVRPLPLGPQLLAWSVVVLLRLDDVQRLLGGPAMDRRSTARQVLGCLVTSAAAVSSGLAVLVPAACLLVVAVHAQWDRRPSLCTAAVLGVVLVPLSQALVATGLVGSLVDPATSAVVAGTGLLVALATCANLVVLARQRGAADAAAEHERAERDAALVHAVDHDPLTGVLGRRGLERHLAGLASAQGCGGVAAVVLDLDGFKPVNDEHGHAAGDAVLVATAGRLRSALPPGALLARTGGDEFVAVVLGVPDEEGARAVAARLARDVEPPVTVGDGVEVHPSASAGAAWAERPAHVRGLLLAADATMYELKRARRT